MRFLYDNVYIIRAYCVVVFVTVVTLSGCRWLATQHFYKTDFVGIKLHVPVIRYVLSLTFIT